MDTWGDFDLAVGVAALVTEDAEEDGVEELGVKEGLSSTGFGAGCTITDCGSTRSW